MKFFTLIALVGYTQAIKIAGPNGTVHVDGTFDPPKAPVVPVVPPVNDNIHPGTTLTPYVDPNTLAQTQGPNGTIHVDGTFNDPQPTPSNPVLVKPTPSQGPALA